MSAELAWAIATGAAVVVGLAGIVVPVLPGLPLILGGLLVWAVVAGEPAGWVAFVVGLVVSVTAWVLMYYVPGKRLQAAGVPNRVILLAALAGIVGFFIVPVIGLPLFFVAAVYLQESLRHRDVRASLGSTWQAVLAYGLSLLIELTAGVVAATAWLLAVLVPRL
ncbi:MAG: DUF456 domain-containing protein [Kineosporiaceae bacterium]